MFFLFYNPEDAPDYGASLIRLARALDIARNFVPDISVGTLATFLAISMHSKKIADLSKPLPQLAEDLGIPYSRMMRHLDVLSDGTPSAPGHKLLEKYLDPRAKRNRKFAPSAKGDLLIKRMITAIEGDDKT